MHPPYRGRTQAPSANDAKRECWNEGKTICSARKSHSSAKLGVAEDVYLPLSFAIQLEGSYRLWAVIISRDARGEMSMLRSEMNDIIK